MVHEMQNKVEKMQSEVENFIKHCGRDTAHMPFEVTLCYTKLQPTAADLVAKLHRLRQVNEALSNRMIAEETL